MTERDEQRDAEARRAEERQAELRRAELIGAALADELTADEQAEFDALRSVDPSIDAELDSFGIVLGRLSRTAWTDASPDASADEALRTRILGIPAAEAAGAAPAAPSRRVVPVPVGAVAEGRRSSRPRSRSPRRPWRVVAAGLSAAACIGIGAGGLLVAQSIADRPVVGGPGTLGAVEAISFTGEPSDVEIDGSLVAHTWGTETILTVAGLGVGEVYDVVLVTQTGEELSSGSFLGSSAVIDCEMNAAVMREAVVGVEIKDVAGTTIASAALPVIES